MGEALPTATWRTSPMMRAMTSASSSSSRNVASGCTALMDVLLEITRKTLWRGSEPGVFGKVLEICRIIVGERQRPATVGSERDRCDVETGQGTGGEHGIVKQVAVVELFHRDDGLRGRMRHGRELALTSDPHIAGTVRHRGVDERDIGLERGQQHD